MVSVTYVCSFGTANFSTHTYPNKCPTADNALIEFSRIAYTGSLSQLSRNYTSFSLKKGSPSYLARSGNCWITVTFTLQFLWLLRSLIAGMKD